MKVCVTLAWQHILRNTLQVQNEKLLRKVLNKVRIIAGRSRESPVVRHSQQMQQPECGRFGIFNTSIRASHPIMRWPRISSYFEVFPKASIWKTKKNTLTVIWAGLKKIRCAEFFFTKLLLGARGKKIILKKTKQLWRRKNRSRTQSV